MFIVFNCWSIETCTRWLRRRSLRRLTSSTQTTHILWRKCKNLERYKKYRGRKVSVRYNFREKKIWFFYLIFLKRKKFREIRFLKYKIQRFFFFTDKKVFEEQKCWIERKINIFLSGKKTERKSFFGKKKISVEKQIREKENRERNRAKTIKDHVLQ